MLVNLQVKSDETVLNYEFCLISNGIYRPGMSEVTVSRDGKKNNYFLPEFPGKDNIERFYNFLGSKKSYELLDFTIGLDPSDLADFNYYLQTVYGEKDKNLSPEYCQELAYNEFYDIIFGTIESVEFYGEKVSPLAEAFKNMVRHFWDGDYIAAIIDGLRDSGILDEL